MTPKKSKEQTLTLSEIAENYGGSANTFDDDEAEYMPTFDNSWNRGASAQTSSWPSGGGMGDNIMRAEPPIPDFPPFSARFGNLSYDVDEEKLDGLFAENGLKVDSVRLPRDNEGRIRGTAFVDFSSKDDLLAALKLSGSQFLNRNLQVSVAEQRMNQNQTSFDWSQRGSVERRPQGPELNWHDRSEQPRPRFMNERPPQPSFNWNERDAPPKPSTPFGNGRFSGPFGQAGAGLGEGEDAARFSRLQRQPRQPRQPAPDLDWSARDAPPAAGSGFGQKPQRFNGPKPGANKFDLDVQRDWSSRVGVKPAGTRDSRPKPAQAQSTDAKTAKPRTAVNPFGVLEEES